MKPEKQIIDYYFKGKVAEAKTALNQLSGDVDFTTNYEGYTLVSACAARGDTLSLAKLLAAAEKQGLTPDAWEQLLTARTRNGKTALSMAIDGNHDKCVAMIVVMARSKLDDAKFDRMLGDSQEAARSKALNHNDDVRALLSKAGEVHGVFQNLKPSGHRAGAAGADTEPEADKDDGKKSWKDRAKSLAKGISGRK